MKKTPCDICKKPRSENNPLENYFFKTGVDSSQELELCKSCASMIVYVIANTLNEINDYTVTNKIFENIDKLRKEYENEKDNNSM